MKEKNKMKVGEQIKEMENMNEGELRSWVNEFNREFWEKEMAKQGTKIELPKKKKKGVKK